MPMEEMVAQEDLEGLLELLRFQMVAEAVAAMLVLGAEAVVMVQVDLAVLAST